MGTRKKVIFNSISYLLLSTSSVIRVCVFECGLYANFLTYANIDFLKTLKFHPSFVLIHISMAIERKLRDKHDVACCVRFNQMSMAMERERDGDTFG